MNDVLEGTIGHHLIGDSRPRRAIFAIVVGLLLLASVAFVLGLPVGLSTGWILVAVGIAVLAGWWGAGLGPTVGTLWLLGLWWFAFPPLVGYLGGGWANPSRYTHPRMLGFAYTSARAELLGGIEYGLKFGLVLAVVLGTVGYIVGAILDAVSNRLEEG